MPRALGGARGFKVTPSRPRARRPAVSSGPGARRDRGRGSPRRSRCSAVVCARGLVERGGSRRRTRRPHREPRASQAARCIPAPGVYAGWLDFGDGWRPAATGIGTRPTFGGGSVTSKRTSSTSTATSRAPRRLALARRIASGAGLRFHRGIGTAMAHDIDRTREIVGRLEPPV